MARDSDIRGAVDRRRFLKAGGAVTTAGLMAGCSGGGGSGGSGDGGSGSDGGSGDGGSGGEKTTKKKAEFPQKEIKFIVPYGPGGGYDFYTRTLAQVMNEKDIVPVNVKVENVEGAGGITATNQVYNADPDGYTNMIINTEAFAIAQVARPDATQYELSKMSTLPRVAGTLRAVGVSTQTDIKNFKQLNEATKNGEINWGNQGPTTTSAVMVKALAELGGDATFSLEQYNKNSVTFDGRGAEYTALKRGDTHVMTGSYSSLTKFVESGDLRYALVYDSKDSCPEGTKNNSCVTFKTSEVPIKNTKQINAVSGGPFHRIFAGPPGIPDERHKYLCEKITEAIKDPLYKKKAKEAERPIKYADCETSDKGLDNTIETFKQKKDVLKKLGLM